MRKYIYLTFITALVLVGCIDEIDFESPRNIQDAISIQAKLTHGPQASLLEVEVIRVFDFTGVPQNINVREVRLINLSSEQFLIADGAGVNKYTIDIPDSSPEMNINYEDEYAVRVEALNGDIFESAPEKLIPSPGPLTVDHSIVQQREVDLFGDFVFVDRLQYDVSGSTVNPMTTDLTRMRWTFEQAYQLTDEPESASIPSKTCYAIRNQGANIESVKDPNERGESMLTREPVIDVVISDVYSEGNYLLIYQQTLSETAFEYFDQIRQVINLEGSLFDAPAGKITTNFKSTNDGNNEVFGFFYMTEIDTLRHFVSPDFLGNPTRRCPPVFSSPPPRPCFIESCCDCLLEENSTTEKPVWWID